MFFISCIDVGKILSSNNEAGVHTPITSSQGLYDYIYWPSVQKYWCVYYWILMTNYVCPKIIFW